MAQLSSEVSARVDALAAAEHLRTMNVLRAALVTELQIAADDADRLGHSTQAIRLLIATLAAYLAAAPGDLEQEAWNMFHSARGDDLM